MAPRSTNLIFFFFFMFFVIISASSIQARKLLNNNSAKVVVVPTPTLEDKRLFFNALPKGKVPSSTPTKKGHSVGDVEEKLIARHLASVDRILRSVPSPGVGH